jgi:hypothetical protein
MGVKENDREHEEGSISRNLNKADQIVAEQRDIQAEVANQSGETGSARSSRATQAGARLYPYRLFPNSTGPKPGEEAALDPTPMYDSIAAQVNYRIKWRS